MTTKSVAEKPIRDRAERGISLFRVGAVSRHGDALVVRGTRRAYTVFMIGGEPRCDCPDYRERCRDAGHACKHGYAAVVFEAAEACRRGTRPKPKRHR
jgi:uncharacterized Zn finger protein